MECFISEGCRVLKFLCLRIMDMYLVIEITKGTSTSLPFQSLNDSVKFGTKLNNWFHANATKRKFTKFIRDTNHSPLKCELSRAS